MITELGLKPFREGERAVGGVGGCEMWAASAGNPIALCRRHPCGNLSPYNSYQKTFHLRCSDLYSLMLLAETGGLNIPLLGSFA